MIYYTGDKHGSVFEIKNFCRQHKLTAEDIIVILGDVGTNYYGGKQDTRLKEEFAHLKPTILCIHGNHEMRPEHLPSYTTRQWNGGTVWYEERYPKLLFAKDGETFNLGGLRHLVIGGAYSVDKYYRLTHGYAWWEDEQPSEETKRYVEKQLLENKVDIILSHTCPFKYIPLEAFLPMIDQSTVDDSTERWLDTIEDSVDYKAWFCGHWHINKRIDKIHFLFHNFECGEQYCADNPKNSNISVET